MTVRIEWAFDDQDPGAPVMITGGWKMYVDGELITKREFKNSEAESIGTHSVVDFRVMLRQIIIACQNPLGEHSDWFGAAGVRFHASNSGDHVKIRLVRSGTVNSRDTKPYFKQVARKGVYVDWHDLVDELYDAYDRLCEYARENDIDPEHKKLQALYSLLEELEACVEARPNRSATPQERP